MSIEYYKFISSILLFLIGLAFVLNDWIISIYSFSDIILGIILVLLVLLRSVKLSLFQLKILILLSLVIVFNNTLHYFGNDLFNIKLAFASTVKIMFYTTISMLIYKFILENKFYKKFIVINNIIMCIVSVIGLYILLSLYVYDLLPFEFFWTFTRNDGFRYIGEQTIFRVNSIFSEPAHFGYYLNIIIIMNLSLDKIKNVNITFIFIAIIMNVTTLSYSSIGIMIIILGLFLFKRVSKIGLVNKKFILAGVLVMLFIIYLQWDLINETLVQRSIKILSGEDISGINRLIGSWKYVNQDNLVLGNGIGHTPPIWSVYAYAVSDLGLMGLSALLILNLYIAKRSLSIGVVFFLMNMAKGGYLSPIYWLMVVYLCMVLAIQKNRMI